MGRCRMTALAGACEGDGREEVRLGKVRPSYWIESEGLTGSPKQCREMKNWMQNSRKNCGNRTGGSLRRTLVSPLWRH